MWSSSLSASYADGSQHTLPAYWDMSDPVSDPRWPSDEPFGLVYEEEAFLGLLGVAHAGTVDVAAAAPAAEAAAALALM